MVAGKQRSYRARIPATDSSPRSAILFLHAEHDTADRFEGQADIVAGAKKLGYVLVLPSAEGEGDQRRWQYGPCPDGAPGRAASASSAVARAPASSGSGRALASAAPSAPTDDLAYLRAVLADMKRAFPIDARRVYAVGVGSGAGMVHRLIAEASGDFAAFAAVGGELGCRDQAPTPWEVPAAPIALMMVHGQADEMVALESGKKGRAQTGLGGRDTLAHYLKAKACEAAPQTTTDEKLVTERHACPDQSEILLLVPEGVGDGWPKMLGRKYSMRVIHEFFERHRLP